MTYSISSERPGVSRLDEEILRKARIRHNLKSNGLLRAGWRLYRKLRPAKPQPLQLEPVAAGDLVIIYRHVFISQDGSRFPHKARPAGFDYVKCFQQLVETIDASKNARRVRIIVLYNGTGSQLATDPFEKYLQKCDRDIEVRLLNASSAFEAVLAMMRTVRDMPLKENDIVYLLENDYLHADGWVDEVFTLYESGLQFDYASLYDHPDRYKYPENYSHSTIYVTKFRHWTTAQSTCGTFMTRHEVFLRDFQHLYTLVHDHAMFTNLTVSLGRKLLTPLPGLSVHCMSEHLDPLQRFEEYFLQGAPAAEENA